MKTCGYCGAAIPAELLFTSEEIDELDREQKQREILQKAKERTEKERDSQDRNTSYSGN
jgi:predicted nucleic acid-binding Zn ribbon protein